MELKKNSCAGEIVFRTGAKKKKGRVLRSQMSDAHAFGFSA
jgi:hypothetical protein